MDVQFDFFGQPEIPFILLCNPDKSELYSLGLAYNTEINLNFNSLSEFKFDFPKSIDGGTTNIEAYDYIQNKRLVRIEGYGYFLIIDSEEDLNGSIPIKKVTCNSLEADLISKRLVAYGGTVALYNIVSPAGTLLDDMIKLAPTWSIGNIDTELMVKFRTFNVSDTNIYNFLMVDVCKAFECVFFFDTDNKTISAKTIENATIQTDIFLSFDNIIKDATFSEKSDEITTCLSVYGGGVLNIRAVNPLGTDKIYDFSYYTNSNWMSSSLVTAVNNWNNLIDSLQLSYANLLTLLITYNSELIVLNGTLDTLNSELLALEGVQKVRIQQGLPYSDIVALMVAKQSQITAQQILITNKQTQINSTTTSIVTINNQVSFSTNFSPSQLLELNNFIYENTYKNENIIQTDSMTLVEIQHAEQALYDQAITVLARVSQPRYEISMNSANYIALEEFSVFTTQTEVGATVIAEIETDVFIETVLLKITFGFNDPINFSMLFSNRVRIDGSGFMYSDLVGNVVKTGSAVSFDNYNWSNWSNNYKDDVTNFITSDLNTTTNNLISNSNQEILINENGLRARNYSGGTYSLKQAWLVNNVLAFSDDGFLTSKLALGEVSVPGGGTAYGVVGGVIVGNILAGNSLRISNGGNNFVLDQTGATLTNAKFTLTSTNTKIFIDPTAIKVLNIQKNQGGTFVDKFWVDNVGNVNFAGILSAATGTFSGSLSAATGTFAGSLSAATGTFAGALSAATGTFSGNISGASGTFTGNIQAVKLLGLVDYSQLTNIPFQKISTGVAPTGVALQWPGGVSVTSGTSGFISIAAPLEIEISSNSGANFMLQDSGGINMHSEFGIIFNVPSSAHINIEGKLYTYSPDGFVSGRGLNQTVNVTTPAGNRFMRFDNGILVQYTA